MKTQTKESIWTGWKGALAVILFAATMALLFCSCSSKSDQLMQTKYENCVVLDTSYPNYYILTYTEGYEYRIQRIENQGTIITIYSPKIWPTGDTILLRFLKHENSVIKKKYDSLQVEYNKQLNQNDMINITSDSSYNYLMHRYIPKTDIVNEDN